MNKTLRYSIATSSLLTLPVHSAVTAWLGISSVNTMSVASSEINTKELEKTKNLNHYI
jgi:hypothetical protein